ncbi:c-type cytochrome biogenesis protein CcmI [Peteryoungia desertarenae]|uniref:C-type cytochrome biogenesis protein CcmI n=1 Tax=Peteryoungia desertarenae TaxID=1813451 RepID=A0ABX6QN43_9HYPH|nr:c-type cytochrome biogenesis protein CcmI [Peteryoungia desertarenae]QLF69882.1 c-type cytochrome biogenesis protein CcmI [Peteryoungia desertarenae]
MLFWIISAFLTVAVAVSLLLPLLKGSGRIRLEAEGEAAVYRDQLKELERDKGLGLISDEDAAYARAEIGRRLLAISPGEGQDAPVGPGVARKTRNSLAQAFVILCLPAIGLSLYLAEGNPGMPDQPLSARLANPGGNIELMVAQVERHLASNPDDGAGWDVLGPIYVQMNRLQDAEQAFRNAIRILGPTADRMSALGETIMARNDGIVTEDARMAFQAALKIEPNNPRADFYLALALEQSGRRDEALAAFQAIAAASPPEAPWMPLVNQHIATNGGQVAQATAPNVTAAAPAAPTASAAPGNPSAEDIAAAQSMADEDRNAMIRGMVDSLDQRLKDDPNNFEGWMRLVRSYAMLREPDRATDALKAGLQAFPASGAEGQQLIALARDLGLNVEEALQ